MMESLTNDERAIRRAWEIYAHGDILRTYRISYGLVAQAMFMVSFVTILSSGKDSDKRIRCVEIALCVFGIGFSYIQLLLGRSLSIRLRLLRTKYLSKADPVFLDYEEAFESRLGSVQTIWIPAGLAAVWLVMFIVAILA